MGLATAEKLLKPGEAVVFWTRFWEDRELDFTAPAVRRAVTRLVDHGNPQREKEIVVVDTFALEELVLAMKTTQNRVALSRLARIASHVAGRSVFIPHDAPEPQMRRAVADWEEWWFVHRTDYVALEGTDRVSATVGETRYGKWIARIASGHLGLTSDGEAVSEKLWRRAPLTLLITIFAMVVSYALAIPIGVVAAWRRGRAVDTVTAGILFALYSLPTFWLAELLWRASLGSGAASGIRLALPVIALSLASLATLSRYQRMSMLDVIRQDYVRTARAKGVSGARLLVVHVLRNALLPTVTLAGLQLPALLGGAFVVEVVFNIPGLGYETVRAVEHHDVSWLVATIVLSAGITTLGLIASDVAYGVLDPRVRETLTRREEAHA
jgi:peptide/nickel transport system permease protein